MNDVGSVAAATLALLLGIVPAASTLSAQTRSVLQAAPAAAQSGSQAGSGQTAAAPLAGSLLPSSAVADNYVIGPNDIISITVWKEAGVSEGGVPVRSDGKVTVPLIGDIEAAGFTPTQLAGAISTALKKFLQDPLVTVGVISSYPKEIFVVGEVAHAGPVILTPGMTPLQAVAAAGGPSPYAKTKIYILRMGPSKVQQKIKFDYKKAFRDGDQQGVTIQPGDTIVVP